jgi:outer membrane protein assembly factor BamB
MDPLARPLACDCVAGYAQREYDRLGKSLKSKLRRRVEIAYTEGLASPLSLTRRGVDLVVGKFSVVRSDAEKLDLRVRTLAMLTGPDGEITQTGLFVVRHDDDSETIEDLAGRRLRFGPEESEEKSAAAFAALEAFDVPLPANVRRNEGCSTAALAVVENDADAAVISSYAMPLLKGCGTIGPGELRILHESDPVPFVGVFATDRVDAELEHQIWGALDEVDSDPNLLAALESEDGFVRLAPIEEFVGWNDWRGRRRNAVSPYVPGSLPERPKLLWSHTLTGAGMSGLAVAAGCVVVADKDLDETKDIFRCLDADTGQERWKIVYAATGEMDFTNSPRANPVIRDGKVDLLGAFGDLYCVELEDGEVVWQKDLVRDFGAKRPTWGYSSTPLVVGDKLIVNPGAEDASLVALDRQTGKVLWRSPGEPAAYASFILAELGGTEQIVGYDAISLGGWDPETGRRLWRLVPEWEGDFNVPTPIVVDGKLLVSSENNGTRLHGFDGQGRIIPKPIASSEDLVPDTSTPVVVDGLVFGSCGELLCLDLQNGLETLWRSDKDGLADYCSFIAGDGRILVTALSGEFYLLEANRSGLEQIAKFTLFEDVDDTERDIWSHPALVGNRLYVRNLLGVYCYLLH